MIIMTGYFQHIIQLSYEIDPGLLKPHLPPYTELDQYDNRHFISLVCVQPLRLRVYSIPVPWFRNQAQVNLRFYVRRRISRDQWRHGVVFIRQTIPHHLVAWGARLLYNEPVEALPVECTTEKIGHEAMRVQYRWGSTRQYFIKTAFRQQPLHTASGPEQDFFIDRCWGYCRQRDGGCLEYGFNHPPWKTYRALEAETVSETGDYYGSPFTEVLSASPDFAFGSRGSAAALDRGHYL